MRIHQCPVCQRRYWDWQINRYSQPLSVPMLICTHCHTAYPDPSFVEPALKPYHPPRRAETLLCGLWTLGVPGLAIIILGTIFNQLWITIVGGLIFSFWILLVAMSLCLWQEVCRNAQKAYDASKARLNAQK